MGKSKDNKASREAKADKKLALGLGVKRKQLKRKKGRVLDDAVESEGAAEHGFVEDKELVGSKKNILAKQKRKNKRDKVTGSHTKVDLVELLSDSKDGTTPELKKQKNKKKFKEGNSPVEVQKSPLDTDDVETLKLKKKAKKKFKEDNSSVEVQRSPLDSSDAETLKLKRKKRKMKEGKSSVEPSDAEEILHENQDDEILSSDGNQLAAQSEVMDIEDPEKTRRKKNKTKKVKKFGKVSKEDTHVSNKENKLERHVEIDTANVDEIPSVDEDCSRGMKKWIIEYKNKQAGLKVLQQRIDEFIIAHEEHQEQERKEREARTAGDGWTVVVHHKGRKKTTDTETGTAVGSVSLAAMQAKISKKQPKEVGPNFYRFQKREAQITELAMLQSKFEQDKKRIQQLRAQRKFKPY